MSEQNETIADISNEIRGYFDLLKRGLIPDNVARMTTRQRHQFWADRIETAVKLLEDKFGMALAISEGLRKRDAKNSSNSAAMREALEELVYRKCLVEGHCGKPMNELCTHTGCIWHKYRAALAAPARNADRFQTAEEAQKAWAEYNHNYGPFEHWAMAAIDRLFAPASPQDKQKSCPS